MKLAVMLLCVFFINAPGQIAQATLPNDILYDDCFTNRQPKAALLTHDYSGTKQFDYFGDKWTKLLSTSYRARYTGADISYIDSGGNGGLKAGPIPIHTYFDKVVSWIRDSYRARVVKDNYGSTRLLLLSFGLVGLVGIRRKFTKSRSAQNPGEKKGWIKEKSHN